MALRTVIWLSRHRNSLPPGAIGPGLEALESQTDAVLVHRRRPDRAAGTPQTVAAPAAVARQTPLSQRALAHVAAHGPLRPVLRIRRDALLRRGRCARGRRRRAAR